MSDAKSQKQKKGAVPDGGDPSFVPGSEPLENEQHERFVQELLMLKPAVRAYLKAYPDSSYNSARAASSRLLAEVSVKDRHAFLKEERRHRYRMTADDIHERLVMAANLDPDDLLDGNGKLLPISKLPPEVRLCVESVERRKDGTVEVKTISKTNALQMLGRHQKMFTDKVDVTVRHTLEEIVGGEE